MMLQTFMFQASTSLSSSYMLEIACHTFWGRVPRVNVGTEDREPRKKYPKKTDFKLQHRNGKNNLLGRCSENSKFQNVLM